MRLTNADLMNSLKVVVGSRWVISSEMHVVAVQRFNFFHSRPFDFPLQSVAKNDENRDACLTYFPLPRTLGVIRSNNKPILCTHFLRKVEVIFQKGKSRGIRIRKCGVIIILRTNLFLRTSGSFFFINACQLNQPRRTLLF